jgi:hypothetical protein
MRLRPGGTVQEGRLAMGRTAPPDPLSPVHAFAPVYSATTVTSPPRELPGIWTGNGLEASGIDPMSETNPDHLERLLAEQGGYEVILLEPDELPGTLARWRVIRTQAKARSVYLEALAAYAALTVPAVVQQLWDQDSEDLTAAKCRFAVSMWAHPVSTCWPVRTDAWHAHCIVLGRFWREGSH